MTDPQRSPAFRPPLGNLALFFLGDFHTDAPGMAELLEERLHRPLYYRLGETLESFRQALIEHPWNLVFYDLDSTQCALKDVLQTLRQIQPVPPLLALATTPTVEAAVETMRLGAYAYTGKHDLQRLADYALRALAAHPDPASTAYTAAEAALRASEEKYRSLIESADAAISMVDFEGYYQFVNQIAAANFRAQPEALIGKSVRDLFPEQADQILRDVRKTITSETGMVLETRVDIGDRPCWFRTSIQPVRGSDGKPYAAMIYATEVTEQKQAEQTLEAARIELETRVLERTAELRQVTDRLEAIFNHSDDAILRVQDDLTIRQANPAFETLLGLAASDYLDVPLIAFVGSEYRGQIENVFQAVVQTHEARRIETALLRTDGAQIPVEISVSAVNRTPYPVSSLVCIVRDISERRRAEEALRESEARYRTTIASMAEGIVLQTRDGQIQLANAAAEQILGLTIDQLMGRTSVDPHWRAIHEDGTPFPGETHPAMVALRTGQPQTDAVMGVHKPDDTLTWIAINAHPILEPGQTEPYAVVATFSDITQRKLTQEVLERKLEEERQLQSYMRALHETTLQLTRTTTLDDFYRVAVEQGLARFGFERMGLLLYDPATNMAIGTYGTDAEGRLIPEHHLRMPPENQTGILSRTMDRGQRFAFDADADLYTRFERVGRGQNAVAALWNDEVLGWLCVDNAVHHRPISPAQLDILALYALTTGALLARKHAEFALRASEVKFRQIIESAPIAAIVTDRHGMIVLVNKAAEKAFGYARHELLSQSVDLLVPEVSRHAHQGHRGDYLAGKTLRPHAVELSARRRDGSTFSADIQLSLVDADSAPLVICFILDTTHRKQTENALRQALIHEKELGDLKSRFVLMASHEFRTPLASILAVAESLSVYRDRMEAAQIETRLRRIREQVLHMKQLMDDMLQLARIQTNRVEFTPTYGDLDALCREIIREHEANPANRGRIEYHCEHAPVNIAFDRRWMRYIVSNLISNALKYSAGASIVQVRLNADREKIVLRVTDRGIGIPDKDWARVFEPFYRAHNVGAISGTGIGLSITKQAVDLHDGTITLESRIGSGTTFTVSIPITA